jgi:8-oxo-dGTP diphosphatase
VGDHERLLVSAGIIYRRGQVLVGQRREADRHPLKWEFPGGKVEPGESPQAALVRELREELQIIVTVGAQLSCDEHEYASGSCVRLLFFAVPTFIGQLKNLVYKQIRWTCFENLETFDFLKGDVKFVRRLAQGEFEQQLEG